VWDDFSGGHDILRIAKSEMPRRDYVGRFIFTCVVQGKRVGALSGGERGRPHPAQRLPGGGTVLLLDDPTNDLVIETLRPLENALL
ncbi:energy-dependent translational throttle protein EttA, partial [Erwinia amylovora]|nr:energy-dependent translational throttle protein EttA [Erwinia amylovora]